MVATPTAAFSFSAKVQLRNVPGVLGALCTAIGAGGGNIAALEGFEAKTETITREMAVNARDEDHAARLIEIMRQVDGVELIDQSAAQFVDFTDEGEIDRAGFSPLLVGNTVKYLLNAAIQGGPV